MKKAKRNIATITATIELRAELATTAEGDALRAYAERTVAEILARRFGNAVKLTAINSVR